MAQKPPRRSPLGTSGLKARPVQDVDAAKQAAQFPGVGMTLRSYRYDPSDNHKFPAGKGVVVHQGRFARIREMITLQRVAILLSLIVLVGGGLLGGSLYITRTSCSAAIY